MWLYITISCLLVSVKYSNENLSISQQINKIQSEQNVTNNTIGHDQVNYEDRCKLEATDCVPHNPLLPVGSQLVGLEMVTDKGELIKFTTDVIPVKGSINKIFRRSVSFFLHTRKNPIKPQEIIPDYHLARNLGATNFNSQRPTVFITHGWLNDGRSRSCTLIRDAYLQRSNVNVIIIDWGPIAIGSYRWAVKRSKFIGKRVAAMIDYLESINALDTEQTTLVGHSLGAHIVGIAAFNSRRIIKTIFGLDPAFPMFKYASPGSRISIYDAAHVQIIHTNGGWLGYDVSIGRSDFYPNGGTSQFGCAFSIRFICSHFRAVRLFAESLNTTRGFYGKHCTSRNEFLSGACHGPNVAKMGGLTVDPHLRGAFYLWTNKVAPFAVGMAG